MTFLAARFTIETLWSAGCSLILFTVAVAQEVEAEKPAKDTDYHFNGQISREVLENYLSRSATVASLLHLTSADDLRMMQNTGVKFAGRVIWMWGKESRIDALIERARPFVKTLHEMDPDLVLQGAIFEVVTTDVDKIAIPEEVFREFGLPVEVRNFQYKKMLYGFRHRHMDYV